MSAVLFPLAREDTRMLARFMDALLQDFTSFTSHAGTNAMALDEIDQASTHER